MSLNHPLLSLLSTDFSEDELAQLALDGLTTSELGQLFQTETCSVLFKRRLQLFRAAFPTVQEFCQQQFQEMTVTHLESFWQFWIPLALWLADRHQSLARPWVQGILGGQGTGKTTLAAILTLLLKDLGYTAVTLSLDDLYKTHSDRQHLRAQDPRFIWRGPPGTHDIQLGIQVLDALRQPTGDPIALPRFDKSLHHGSGDRIAPACVTQVDVVLFEGWFVGVEPIDSACFDQAPAPIETEDDRGFAHDVNARLVDYLPLWERLDSLLVLQLADYRWSQQWRRQAEQKMRAEGRGGMSDAELDAFVTYFWKALHPQLFIPPLRRAKRPTLWLTVQADHTYTWGDAICQSALMGKQSD